MRSPGLVDLHRHLDGSIRPATLDELAASHGVGIPDPLHFTPGMGLDEALARFGFTLSLLQDPETVRRVAAEMCEDAAEEGVTTLEIRFAPQLHRGGAVEEVVDAAVAGADGRAGIVLCGLYGEPPEVLERLVTVAAGRRGVVGIDLAGGPAPGHRFSLSDYAAPYRRAAELGLGRTVHAGEGRPSAEVAAAVEELGAVRIGHGVTLLEDPRVVDVLVERGVTIEACLTSNVQTGVIPSVEAHPLPQWLEAGVRACLCADNTLFSQVDARAELEAAETIPGMDQAKLETLIACGHQAAFRRR